MEKFAIRKAERFLDQGYFLTLPSLELIYVWNGFRTLGRSWDLVDPVYVLVEKTLKDLGVQKGSKKKYDIHNQNLFEKKPIFIFLSRFQQVLC